MNFLFPLRFAHCFPSRQRSRARLSRRLALSLAEMFHLQANFAMRKSINECRLDGTLLKSTISRRKSPSVSG